MATKTPVQSAVRYPAAGAGLGAATGGFLCWLIDTYVHTPGVEGDLPGAVTTFVLTIAAAGVAWLAGRVKRLDQEPSDA